LLRIDAGGRPISVGDLRATVLPEPGGQVREAAGPSHNLFTPTISIVLVLQGGREKFGKCLAFFLSRFIPTCFAL